MKISLESHTLSENKDLHLMSKCEKAAVNQYQLKQLRLVCQMLRPHSVQMKLNKAPVKAG